MVPLCEANKIFEKIPYIKTQTELGEILNPKRFQIQMPGGMRLKLTFSLQSTICRLQNTITKSGRVNKYTAEAVKAQAHMYQKEYALAKPLLDDIIASNKFSLVPEYTCNYDMTHENNAESIFELQCSTTATSASTAHGFRL